MVMTGCNSIPNNDEDNLQTNEATSAEVEFSQQDFCLYSESDENGDSTIIAWLGMSDEYESEESFINYYKGFDNGNGIRYIEGADSSGKPLRLVDYLNYTGAGRAVMTTKGIVTYGYEYRKDDYVSSADDVIANYGLDPENENIYINYVDDENCVIALYFNIDDDKNVTRIKSSLDTDISDISSLNADYSLKFIIMNGKVCGIQMLRDHSKIYLGN